ncbi:hypothetical protein Vafri_14767 [Volvox africanus]|uniref:Zinc-finger domain-containing protein n=1 Tax=Volvox africanus TaxID=51714 RepID=A0A8J4BE47_9CHLO|nr:hypothetical protein Vafri_14767 [Volvox africanus]
MEEDFDTKVEAQRRAVQQKLIELGLAKLTSDLTNSIVAKTAAAARPRKSRKYEEHEPVAPRRSTRERTQVTYNEDIMFDAVMPKDSHGVVEGGGTKRPLELTAEEVELVEALTAAKMARTHAAARETSKGPRGPRDSGKGVRRQGGQVYDSSNGITCHWCRQKTITAKVTCTHPFCGGGRSMPRSFWCVAVCILYSVMNAASDSIQMLRVPVLAIIGSSPRLPPCHHHHARQAVVQRLCLSLN